MNPLLHGGNLIALGEIILTKVKCLHWKMTHQFGIELPNKIEEVYYI